MRSSAIQGDQSSERKQNTATGLTPLVSRRSIVKVTRRIGQRTPQFPPHLLLPGLDEAFAQDATRNRNERIEIERALELLSAIISIDIPSNVALSLTNLDQPR